MISRTSSYIEVNKLRLSFILGTFFAIIAIFLIVPIFEKNFYTHLFLQCSFTLLIFSTIYVFDERKTTFNISLLLLIPFIYFDTVSFHYQSLSYLLIAYGLSSLFTLSAIIVLLRKILLASFVNAQLIVGALMVYFLSGILWADLYFIENLITPGSFQGTGTINFSNSTFLGTYEHQFNFLYYSFATLATLGMGDITPLNHLAKSLTAMEAMFGQLYVAIIIAKLVSVWWYVPGKS